jgi:thymidylate synthase (FAD)
MNSVKFVQCTPNPEENMAYIARVSNPNNQDNPSFEGLLKYCIVHEHWSVFEQSFMTLEIETSRAIAAQILRHRSFTYQEFSQRYADTTLLSKEIPVPALRRQDTKNRQNSTDDLSSDLKMNLSAKIEAHFEQAQRLYEELLKADVAKECARFVLPLATPTRIYMSGSVRSWITYIALREKNGTQREHMKIASMCKAIFCGQFPTVSKALGWT